jgi:hypothetical protein
MTVTGTPGTGVVTLNAASSGFQTFATAGVLDGDLVDYTIEDGSNFECGLTRLKVTDSSNSGSAISATSAAVVFVTVLDASVGSRGKTLAASLGQQWP